jgi:hypothetical protein
MWQQKFKAIKSKLIEDGKVEMVERAARGGGGSSQADRCGPRHRGDSEGVREKERGESE